MKTGIIFITLICIFTNYLIPEIAASEKNTEYTVGIDDVLEINILQPDELTTKVTVAPDGSISFPYIGRVEVKGKTLTEIQKLIEEKLADGYMLYPVVSVFLSESRSRKFFVYGEVNNPGSFPMDENITVLRAISMAGGFAKFGSSSRVKILRQNKNKPGYETLKVNMKAIMDGNSESDIVLEQGDIVVVEEGIF